MGKIISFRQKWNSRCLSGKEYIEIVKKASGEYHLAGILSFSPSAMEKSVLLLESIISLTDTP